MSFGDYVTMIIAGLAWCVGVAAAAGFLIAMLYYAFG